MKFVRFKNVEIRDLKDCINDTIIQVETILENGKKFMGFEEIEMYEQYLQNLKIIYTKLTRRVKNEISKE